jgi:transcriptional antiterminator NusG
VETFAVPVPAEFAAALGPPVEPEPAETEAAETAPPIEPEPTVPTEWSAPVDWRPPVEPAAPSEPPIAAELALPSDSAASAGVDTGALRSEGSVEPAVVAVSGEATTAPPEAIPEVLLPEAVPGAPPAQEATAGPLVAEAAPGVPVEPAAAEVPQAEVAQVESAEGKAGAEAVEEPPPKVEEPKSEKMDWYILKVQSNREDSIREGLLRRVAIAGLGRYFGDVIIPTEKVTEFKGGKKRVTKRKLYPGYLVVHMEINDDTWFLVRETPGIGDFTGAAGRPSPMLPHEVVRILAKQEEKSEKAPKLKISFSPGDQVKINEGTFENFEGEVESIDETNGRVTVMINIFGRSTPVELEYWQIGTV